MQGLLLLCHVILCCSKYIVAFSGVSDLNLHHHMPEKCSLLTYHLLHVTSISSLHTHCQKPECVIWTYNWAFIKEIFLITWATFSEMMFCEYYSKMIVTVTSCYAEFILKRWNYTQSTVQLCHHHTPDCLIFITRITILVRWRLYIESAHIIHPYLFWD